jgi:hypothetical protein
MLFFKVGISSTTADMTITNEVFVPPAAGVISFSLKFKHEQNTAFEAKAIAISGDLWKKWGNFILSSATAG